MMFALASVLNLDVETVHIKSRQRKKDEEEKVPSLRDIALKKVKTFPKVVLCAMYAEHTFAEEVKRWRASFPFSDVTHIDNFVTTCFSYPEVRTLASGDQLPLIGIIDSHHILTNLRAKVCSTGIEASGLKRDAWVRLAKGASKQYRLHDGTC